MIKRFYILLLAIVASVGMMNAKVTWKSCNISDLEVYGTYESYSMDGVTLSANADHIIARWEGYEGDESHSGIFFMTDETGGFTFSNTLGKNFTKIEMTLNGPAGWDNDEENLGSGWLFNWNHGEESITFTFTWTGNASTVDLLKDESSFHGENVKRIVFYFEGDSEEPDPTYTVALRDGTANADKVTLSATSVEECTTVTVTPNEECEITEFSATYAVVVGQLGTIYTIDATLNPETGAYSFKMPAADVTIDATIALKLVPEGDIFAGFTATAGSGGFNNEGHANLVDNKFTSADWTKWCADNSYKSVPTGESGDACWWIDFEASAALDLTGYILTTGNDTGNEHGRNPRNWLLKAKLNADDAWTTIATVTGDVTMKNLSFKDYKFFVDQPGSYKYFRFEVFANQGANVMQLCELRLIGTEASAPAAPAGALNGKFSVADGKFVCFSKGNLQYQASTNTWRFAENQYDAVGGNNGKNNAAPYNTSSANHSPSASQTGWIDLFGWAASGISRTGVNAYQPYSTSQTDADYGTTSTKSADETLGNFDWGKNMGDGWRTLTAEEWGYLLGPGNGGTTPSEYRANYQSLRGLCKITVSGTSYPGLIILPDNMYNNLPAEGDIATKWSACAVAAGSLNYTKATFTEAEWTALQAAGAVFLPTAGIRIGTAVYDASAGGDYWSSSASSSTSAFYMVYGAGGLHPENSYHRYYGRSVRLVSDTAPDPAPAGPIPCTAADLGKVLCTDGSIYATVSEATAAGKTAAAVITYVDTENGKALALALADDSDETLDWATAKTTAAAHTPAVNGGTWTLASKDDWNNMITAAGGYEALRDGFSAVGGTNMRSAWYWSSTSFSYYAWCYQFNNGEWFDDYQDGNNYVRACLAFDIPAAPAYETVMNLINAIGTVEYTAESKAKIDEARAAYDALSDGDKAQVTNYSTLTDAETAYANAKAAADQAAADPVIAKINNIPQPVELKLATRDSINNARAAYEALTAAQQALVSNIDVLTNAEAALAALNPGVPPATPLDSAQAVKDLIDAIPTPVEYPTSGPAIAAALVAYQQLSDAAKGALDDADGQKMTDAATQYAALEAIAAIEAIPAEIVYDPAVKAAIETARDKYDALIDASKALVDDEVVAKLTNAEEAWAILVAKVEHNVSYIGKDGELKHETVALLHIPDPAPDFNGYEFVRWDVKAGDFLEEGLRIKAIYTPIITTNPQGFDTLAYNGLAQELVKAGVAKEGHIEYSLYPEEPESWSAELPKAVIAGVYAIYYKLVREGHADYIAPEPTMATIAKVPVTYVAPTAVENLVYTAANQTLIAAGQTNDGTFEYSLNPTLLDSWKAELPQAKDAGTYSVYYRVLGDINHLDSTAVDPIAVTIAKAALTATADDKNVIYGDAVPAYTVTYAGWQGDDDAAAITGDIAFACEYASTSNVGEYTITPSGVDAANYTIEFVNGKVTVAKAESGCVAPVAYDTLVYNGANQTLIMGGQPMGGEMQYSLDTTVLDCWSTSLPQAKNVGTYNVYYRVKGDMNHNDHYYDLIAVSIAKAELTATAEDKTVTYGDAAPEYTVVYAGWHGTDDASVLTGAIAYACDYLPTSNVGEYTITPSGVDAANYAILFINGKVTVNKADLMITADDKNVIYGDEHPEFTASYSGFKNSDDASVVSNLAYTCEYAVTSNVGTYDIVPSSASATNYAISYTNGKITVAQAALTITANDTVMIYGDEHPEFTVTYAGWKNTDDESVVSGLQFSTPYAPGSYIGTYTINPNSATALNYAITFVDGTLTVNKAHVYVSGAEAQIAKFADGHANAVVLEQGVLNGIKLNDPIAHVTTAAFSSADVAEHLTITLFYELTGDAALLNNYNLDPTSEIFTTEGVIIEPFIPDDQPEEKEDEETTVEEGIEIYAYGYCDGSGYSLKYHLESGNPDQYKIDFADSRFTDVDWTNLVITGKDGTIDIDIPVDLPTGDYDMTVYFRDSRFDWLESRQFNVTFHVNLPETYVRPLFDNVIALVDTCHCLTDIQWYWRANSSEPWQPIEGANGYYYHADGKLTGEYFVSAKMNGEPTYTCGQTDMETLYGAGQQAQAPVVRAYPNPVVNTTIVTIENSDNFEHNLRVVNLMGAEVMSTTFEGNETNVEMSGYPQGNYMISVDGIVVKVMKK